MTEMLKSAPGLAPYASHETASRGRLFDEADSATRRCFQRDRDRIIHCGAFRRLEYKTSSQGGFAYTCVYWLCMIIMGILPHFLVAWFSRKREFSADNTSVLLNGADKMVSALKRLSLNKSHFVTSKQMTALGLNNIMLERLVGGISNVKNVFSSHPPLNKRISLIEDIISQQDK